MTLSSPASTSVPRFLASFIERSSRRIFCRENPQSYVFLRIDILGLSVRLFSVLRSRRLQGVKEMQLSRSIWRREHSEDRRWGGIVVPVFMLCVGHIVGVSESSASCRRWVVPALLLARAPPDLSADVRMSSARQMGKSCDLCRTEGRGCHSRVIVSMRGTKNESGICPYFEFCSFVSMGCNGRLADPIQ